MNTNIYDILLTLNKDYIIQNMDWPDTLTKKQYQHLWSSFPNQSLMDVLSLNPEKEFGIVPWKDISFCYALLNNHSGGYYCLLKQISDKLYLYEKALDYINDGIQIYDKNACAVFFNKSSRKISEIPSDVSIEGRHLLDMYELDDTISTTMTALRTGAPVINRVDHYKSSDGTSIATANTAYPIRHGSDLLGTVVFEQNTNIVQQYKHKMADIEKALQAYQSEEAVSSINFKGYTFENIIGSGDKLTQAITLARRVAIQNCHILLVGETGTGKEVFAQSIHRASPRSRKNFLAINCAAVPETLIESLLFGTQKGSFTGSENKAGYFEEANEGTLFLDELNSMSLAMQSKILRVIQENTYRRVGGKQDLHTDVRIISSCNEDPFKAIQENRLRKDLFYRLSTVMIELPSLREHLEDLPLLISYHLGNSKYQFVNPISEVDPDVMHLFETYSWPGNVRELFHVLDYVQNIADGDTIKYEYLPRYMKNNLLEDTKNVSDSAVPAAIDFTANDLQSLMDSREEAILRQSLEHFGSNITKTADALGIRRQSLQYRIKKYGIII